MPRKGDHKEQCQTYIATTVQLAAIAHSRLVQTSHKTLARLRAALCACSAANAVRMQQMRSIGASRQALQRLRRRMYRKPKPTMLA